MVSLGLEPYWASNVGVDMIVFKEISWRNFLSTGNQPTVIDLSRNPSTLIMGKNGSGKSTFLDAIMFALFGKPFRDINKPALVNSINEKGCFVQLKFTIGSKEYVIERGIKPTIFNIFCDNVLLNQDASSRDYQKLLEQNIIKMNERSFRQIVALGSANYVPFMRLPAAHRREVIEDLLDILIFSTMNRILKERMDAAKEELKAIEYKVESAKEKITLQQKFIDDNKSKQKAVIDAIQIEIAQVETNVAYLQNDLTGLKREVAAKEALITDEASVLSRLKEYEDLKTQILATIERHKTEVQFFHDTINCPTCQQTISSGHKDMIVQNKTAKVEQLSDVIVKTEKQLAKVMARISDINFIKNEILSLQLNIALKDNTISNEKENLVKLKRKSENEENDQENSILEEELKRLNDELVEYTRKRTILLENKQYDEMVAHMLKDSGFKATVIAEYLPIINTLINKYLVSFGLSIDFHLDEEFKETIKSRHRDQFSYDSFSEGEKARIDNAIMLTWRAIAKSKNSTNTNLLILDEVFDGSMDGAATEELVNILTTMDKANVFVISHRQDLLDKFSASIEFAKVGQFSKIIN